MADQHIPGAGTPAPGPTPGVVAAVDQSLAGLRDLVQLTRDHRDAHRCAGVPCPGEWAWEEILRRSCHDRAGLLGIALAELAALGYGLPAADDRYWPADSTGGDE